MARGEEMGGGLAVHLAGRTDFRKHGGGDAEDVQQFLVPGAGMDVEQEGAGGVAGIGAVQFSPGQVPEEPAVHGAEQELARLGPGPRVRHVVEKPGELGAGEVGVDDQAGLCPEELLQPEALQVVAGCGGAPVLPDDGVMDRPAGQPVPDQRGFPLVGDPDGGDVRGAHAGADQGLCGHPDLGRPDFPAVLLHPAGPGKYLADFLLRQRPDRAVMVEDNGPGTGGPLVQGKDVVHDASLALKYSAIHAENSAIKSKAWQLQRVKEEKSAKAGSMRAAETLL